MKRVISLILIGILSLPTIFGLNHYLFEEHVVCSEENAHFHEAEISCSTCDFLRANSEFSSEDSTFLIKDFSTNYKQYAVYNRTHFSNFYNYFDSRGPPVDC